MKSFKTSRWAEAYLDAAGEMAEASVAALEGVAPALAQASGGEDRGRALAASVPDSGEGRFLHGLILALGRRSMLHKAMELAEEARKRLDKRNGVARVDVVSAAALDAPLGEGVKAYAMRRTGARQAILRERVDAGILGGLVMEVDGERIDGTLKRRLESLRTRLCAPLSGKASE